MQCSCSAVRGNEIYLEIADVGMCDVHCNGDRGGSPGIRDCDGVRDRVQIRYGKIGGSCLRELSGRGVGGASSPSSCTIRRQNKVRCSHSRDALAECRLVDQRLAARILGCRTVSLNRFKSWVGGVCNYGTDGVRLVCSRRSRVGQRVVSSVFDVMI